MYSNDPKIFLVFIWQNFMLISNLWKKLEKSPPRKSSLPKTFTS
jgi:hypothetical protein